MKKRLNQKVTDQYSMTVSDVATLFKDGQISNVVFCVGAGISTAAGIPDFRSPKTGLYHNLKRLKLKNPEQVFDIDFFRKRPEPFYTLAHELYPGKFQPTLTHSFMRLLHEKNMLLRCFTQNIDTLERRAGLPAERIVEAHGSFAGNHCIDCHKEGDAAMVRKLVSEKKVPRCSQCKGLVKPDIVFFGEGLPELFFRRMSDFSKCDLLIVAGTSLQVHPFASLPDHVSHDTPRVLFNLEEVGNFNRDLDVISLVKCDDGITELAKACGWLEELHALHKKVLLETRTESQEDKGMETFGDQTKRDVETAQKDTDRQVDETEETVTNGDPDEKGMGNDEAESLSRELAEKLEISAGNKKTDPKM